MKITYILLKKNITSIETLIKICTYKYNETCMSDSEKKFNNYIRWINYGVFLCTLQDPSLQSFFKEKRNMWSVKYAHEIVDRRHTNVILTTLCENIVIKQNKLRSDFEILQEQQNFEKLLKNHDEYKERQRLEIQAEIEKLANKLKNFS